MKTKDNSDLCNGLRTARISGNIRLTKWLAGALLAIVTVPLVAFADGGTNETVAASSRKMLSLNFVVRLDYSVTEWLNVFAFVGEYSIVDEAGRRAVKARRDVDGIRDLAYGGCGLSLSF